MSVSLPPFVCCSWCGGWLPMRSTTSRGGMIWCTSSSWWSRPDSTCTSALAPTSAPSGISGKRSLLGFALFFVRNVQGDIDVLAVTNGFLWRVWVSSCTKKASRDLVVNLVSCSVYEFPVEKKGGFLKSFSCYCSWQWVFACNNSVLCFKFG